MSRQLTKLLTLACGALLAACSDGRTLTEAAPPTAASHDVSDPSGKVYTLIAGQLQGAPSVVTQWIGHEGGALVMAGDPLPGELLPRAHLLIVPRGVIKGEPLLFEMRLMPGEHIEVELNAFKKRGRGRGEEVGHRGFRSPVYLALSYAFSDASVDPTSLSIVHLVGNQVQEQMPSTAYNGKVKLAVGELRHFSRYAVAAR